MPDPKEAADDEGTADPNARWGTDAAGVEPIGGETEVEDLTSEEQRQKNDEAKRIRDAAIARAQELADDGEADDEDDGDSERKD